MGCRWIHPDSVGREDFNLLFPESELSLYPNIHYAPALPATQSGSRVICPVCLLSRCHSRESGNPVFLSGISNVLLKWIPAFAGMTSSSLGIQFQMTTLPTVRHCPICS